MCIWAKYIAIVEHKANSARDMIRHNVKSLLGIHLELGEHVKISNIQKKSTKQH
jgi:hypothetical protein